MAAFDWVRLGFACALVVAAGCDQSDVVTPPTQVADGACINPPGATDRFVDCGNGTVTDTQTNLIWLKEARCFTSVMSWVTANREVGIRLSDGRCGLTDHSKPGDWRVPGLGDWASVLVQVPGACRPSLIDKTGTDCFASNPWANGIVPAFYWTSTSGVGYSSAWAADLNQGNLLQVITGQHFLVWAVRDGT
jgi:hypothetical protein